MPSLDLQSEIVHRVLFMITMLLAVFVVVKLSQRLARRYIEDTHRLYRTNQFIRRVGGLLAITLGLVILAPDIRGLFTVLTLIGAGLAIAMREALLSIAGWFRIVTMAPYHVGDRIQINDVHGDVIDVRVLRTTLMEIGGWVKADQSTGRLVQIPNSWIFLYALYNYTQGLRFIWNELALTVTFRSDWEAAQNIMLSLAMESADIIEHQAREEIKTIAREYLIYFNILTPFVYVRIVENGIRLTLRYLCEARKRRGTEHALSIVILRQFREHGGIELAYPQMGITQYEPTQFFPPPPTLTQSQSVNHPSPNKPWNPL